MVRNFLRKEEPVPQAPSAEASQISVGETQVVERVIDLNLINDKLNYALGILAKLAKVAEIDLS